MCFMTVDQAIMAREVLLWAVFGACALAVMIVAAAWLVERRYSEIIAGPDRADSEQQKQKEE